MRIELEGIALVLVGNFNPSIFQPAWLAHEGLIRPGEANDAKIEIIRPEISLFTIGSIKVTVQPERFQLSTLAVEESPSLKDMAVGIFHVLEHTPLHGLGINREMHFKMNSLEDWHTVGHRIVPKEIWSGLLDGPGTRSVIVESSNPPTEGRLTVRLEPSLRVQPGVFVGTNLHFDKSGKEAIDTLQSRWAESQQNARELAESILTRCLEPHVKDAS